LNENYWENIGGGGGYAAPSQDFNKVRFENLVIPLGIDSHINTRPFIPNSYDKLPIKTIDSSLFDVLFEKVAIIKHYPLSTNKTRKISKK
jgi:hypothetical protein